MIFSELVPIAGDIESMNSVRHAEYVKVCPPFCELSVVLQLLRKAVFVPMHGPTSFTGATKVSFDYSQTYFHQQYNSLYFFISLFLPPSNE